LRSSAAAAGVSGYVAPSGYPDIPTVEPVAEILPTAPAVDDDRAGKSPRQKPLAVLGGHP
jgi:hypothetical protein